MIQVGNINVLGERYNLQMLEEFSGIEVSTKDKEIKVPLVVEDNEVRESQIREQENLWVRGYLAAMLSEAGHETGILEDPKVKWILSKFDRVMDFALSVREACFSTSEEPEKESEEVIEYVEDEEQTPYIEEDDDTGESPVE